MKQVHSLLRAVGTAQQPQHNTGEHRTSVHVTILHYTLSVGYVVLHDFTISQ